MGSVWLAEDKALKRLVAVKLIQLAAQDDNIARSRFTREAQAAASLAHPNVITVHDYGVDDGVAFMVMEHLSGPDLATLVSRGGPLPIGLACDYLEQAAAGLGAAHSNGILHRDVKPANLVLTASGGLKVLDFGIASLLEESESLTATSQFIGTVPYMAPERSMGEAATVQSDLYSLGCCAVTLLTGRPPFEGTTGQVLLKHVSTPAALASARRADVPRELDELIAALLAKDPQARPASASVVAGRLRQMRRLRPLSADVEPDAVSAAAPAMEPLSEQSRHAVEQVPPDPDPDVTLLRTEHGESPTAIHPWAVESPAVNASPQSTDSSRVDPIVVAPVQQPCRPAAAVPTRPLRWRVPLLIAACVAVIGAGALIAPGMLRDSGTVAPIAGASGASPGSGATPAGMNLTSLRSVPIADATASLALDASQRRLFATECNESFIVRVFDADTLDRVGSLAVPGNWDVCNIAVDAAAHRLYASGLDYAITVIDTTTLTIVGHITGPAKTWSMVADPAAHRLYAAHTYVGSVSVIDTSSNTIVGTVSTPGGAGELTLDTAHGRLVVVGGDALSVIDTSTLKVTATGAGSMLGNGSAGGLAVGPQSRRIFVAESPDRVAMIDSTTGVGLGTLASASRGQALAFAEVAQLLVVGGSGTVKAIDPVQDKVVTESTCPGAAFGALLDPAARKLYVSSSEEPGAGFLTVYNTG